MFPRARTIVSTSCFDRGVKGEFEGLWRTIGDYPSLADFVMADAHAEFPPFVLEHGRPECLVSAGIKHPHYCRFRRRR
jgi:hypothetical protein